MVGIVYIDFEGRASHSYNLITLIQSIDMSTTRDQVLRTHRENSRFVSNTSLHFNLLF
jgi:hypothetical protein